MRNKDQVAIFESYREEILKKFKDSMSDNREHEPEEREELENEISDIEPEMGGGDVSLEVDDSDNENFGDSLSDDDVTDSLDDDDDFKVEEKPKRKVVVTSGEIGVNIGPKLREILRYLPPLSEDVDILSNIKRAIEKANSKLDDDDQITASPLAVYDKLIELNAISEEEMDSDEFDDKETELLQNFDDDDFSDEEMDYRDELMVRDIEKGKLRDMIRSMGTDWRDSDSDFEESNY